MPKWKVTLVDAYLIHVVFGMLGVQALEEGSSHLHYDQETFVSESPNAGSVPVAMIDSCDYSVIHEEHRLRGCLQGRGVSKGSTKKTYQLVTGQNLANRYLKANERELSIPAYVSIILHIFFSYCQLYIGLWLERF